MKTPTICPFCGSKLKLIQILCTKCGAYRINADNYDKTFKQIYGVNKPKVRKK
jgi:predicted amidophosphoribosyltransferase